MLFRSRHLVLLTDGHTYGDEENCYALARNAAEQGIIISALGIGHEWNDLFLEHLTAITGGSTLLVTSKEDHISTLIKYSDHCILFMAGK